VAVTKTFGDAEVSVGDDLVATVEIRRPPDNFFDADLITSLADAYFWLDDRDDARAIITEHGQVVEALRDALMERDELVGHEITDVIAGCLSQTAGGSPVLEGSPMYS